MIHKQSALHMATVFTYTQMIPLMALESTIDSIPFLSFKTRGKVQDRKLSQRFLNSRERIHLVLAF